MSHQFKLSDKGRQLIKAFEGFRPVDRLLVSGQRIVGYGHKVRNQAAMMVTEAEADDILTADLAPYEDMVNTEIHAPLTQNQFDALVSLAFSIGPKAFMGSPTRHLLNNGRPLDAARSFEIWRKSEIGGKVYIVDALVRRRSQEKALFLEPDEGPLSASRLYLNAIEDSDLASDISETDMPTFEDSRHGYVSYIPYDAADMAVDTPDPDMAKAIWDEDELDDIPSEEVMPSETSTQLTVPSRRREDGPAGILTLSEVVDDEVVQEDLDPLGDLDDLDDIDPLADLDDLDDLDDVLDIDDIVVDAPSALEGPSPIAVAAAEVSDRLDALIEADRGQKTPNEDKDWPESLITAEGITDDIVDDILEDDDLEDPVIVTPLQIDPVPPTAPMTRAIAYDRAREAELKADESLMDYMNDNPPHAEFDDWTPPQESGGLGPYWVMIVTGLTLIGASIGAILRGSTTRFGEDMPFWASLGLIIGGLIVLFALYYVLKSIFRRT